MKDDFISHEDLLIINNERANVKYMEANAKYAQVLLEKSQLELENAVLRTFIKHGLKETDKIENNGKIVREGGFIKFGDQEEGSQNDNA